MKESNERRIEHYSSTLTVCFLNVPGVLQARVRERDGRLRTYWLNYVYEMDFM